MRILILIATMICIQGCSTQYLMKNCKESSLRTSKGEPLSACQKQFEFWN